MTLDNPKVDSYRTHLGCYVVHAVGEFMGSPVEWIALLGGRVEPEVEDEEPKE